ncbi:MAG TPA: hypothetical protein PKL28_16265 [Rhodocyclaceae bacterium]|nr:hypothetical protein [Rhodocyclaceae bacterium]HNN45423.1 hypothetical protein [Azospira sp.]
MVAEKSWEIGAGILLIPNRQQFNAPTWCVFALMSLWRYSLGVVRQAEEKFFNVLNGFRLPLFMPMLAPCFQQK